MRTAIKAIPGSPAGRQLAWYLGKLASAGEGASAAERARLTPALAALQPSTDKDAREAWRLLSSRFGSPLELESVKGASDSVIAIAMTAADGKRWRLSLEVEPEKPHRIAKVDWERIFEFDVTVREATESDGPVLTEIERRCPIVLRGRSVTFDRGEDYFAFARLMEDATVGLGFVDGVPAAINCGGTRSALIGGVKRRLLVAVHTRVLPEHQRKGLWGAVSRILNEKYPPGTTNGFCGFVSVDNVAMQKGFANTPDKWSTQALRAQLSCESLAGPPAGRPATPADAERIVAILNTTHGSEELFLPYTVTSLTERLERAPKQYRWERVWLTDRSVVGVWPAGETIRVIVESKEGRLESRRGLVLDYGFLPGAEDEFERLLRAWCGWLARRGLDTLSIFTSERSAGYVLLRELPSEVEAFDMWTPGIVVPAGASERGLYVDQVYF